jgi:sugar phosphate isomerase/epimerase
MMKIGIQLYTLRDHLAQNFLSTLDQVAQMGVEGVEFAGFGGQSAKTLKKHLAEIGLQAPSAHVAIENLRGQLEAERDYALELGLELLVCPWAKAEHDSGWQQLSDDLGQIASDLAPHGLRLAYHNHDHEITGQWNGQPILDCLLANSPALLAEIDVAWVEIAGQNAAQYLRRYAGRIPVIHLKDFKQTQTGIEMAELGTGEVALHEALLAAQAHGAEWLMVEQDHCSGDPFDSLRQSLGWLKPVTRALQAS